MFCTVKQNAKLEKFAPDVYLHFKNQSKNFKNRYVGFQKPIVLKPKDNFSVYLTLQVFGFSRLVLKNKRLKKLIMLCKVLLCAFDRYQ